MTLSNNLLLNIFAPGVDLDESFEKYRMDLDGPTDSNMTIIDGFLGTTFPALVSALASSSSGSTAIITNRLSSISGSISTINSDLTTIGTRFTRLGTHTGSGQADFNSIPGTYTHIIILGMAMADTPSGVIQNVGIDFNGSTTAADYAAIEWETSGSYNSAGAYGTERFYDLTAPAYISIGQVSGSYTDPFGSAFMAIVPNYSASGSFYKNALGISAFMGSVVTTDFTLDGRVSLAVQGGYWKSTAAITRIRVFSGSAATTRYNFDTGTQISIFGLD
jgi:hypothetical protein